MWRVSMAAMQYFNDMMQGFSSDNGTLLPSWRLHKYPVNCTVSSHRKQNPERISSIHTCVPFSRDGICWLVFESPVWSGYFALMALSKKDRTEPMLTG